MPYPEGIKNYSTSRPIDIKNFDEIKKWWFDRKENKYAWKVPFEEIKTRNFNLDIKNENTSQEEITQSTEELISILEASFQRSSMILDEIKKAFL